MATVASQFGSRAEATAARDALADSAAFAEVETRVYEGDVADDVDDEQKEALDPFFKEQ